MAAVSAWRGLTLVESEVSTLTMAMKRGQLWTRSSESLHPALLQPFLDLKRALSACADGLDSIEPNAFLSPFLDVIRSEVITGPVTGLALASVNKFLAFGLVHPGQTNAAAAVENLADAVTHARFVGVDPSSDEIVLMKIMEVLRTLILSPVGLLLTNESVCEIMQSTFRICFESRLSELLRKNAEHSLNSMIQLLFTRLPGFSEESLPLLKKLKMRSGDTGKTKRRHKMRSKSANRSVQHPTSPLSASTTTTEQSSPENAVEGELKRETSSVEVKLKETEKKEDEEESSLVKSPTEPRFNVDSDVLARSPLGSVCDLSAVQSDVDSQGGPESIPYSAGEDETKSNVPQDEDKDVNTDKNVAITVTSPQGTERKEEENEEFQNPQGVIFTPTADMIDQSGSLIPYGLPCVRELFRFLTSLINPHDVQNQDSMIQIALSLLATALETGAEHLDKFQCFLSLVRDDLARNLVSLLSAERIAVFSSTLWLSYLVFESQRKHMKYQLEIFLSKLCEVVCSESQKVTYEHKELALEMLVRFYRIPGFLTQLYLNFDCDMYTSNTFEDLTKMLSKNAFPVTGLYSTHFLSLDALLTVVEAIETQCHRRIAVGKNIADHPPEEEKTSVPTHEEVMALKHKKKLMTTATEQFNSKPTKGIAYMQEVGLIRSPVEPNEVAAFIRSNPHLDKKQMGEYLSNRKNLVILDAFVKSFDFAGLRIDESLRMFLETFRLPGEAPLITLVLEHFAEHWFSSNPGQVKDADSAFTLSYAVIMLNVDQHNKNHTKTNDPMTEDQFRRNLRGTNAGSDHDQDMLHDIFHAIRGEEIVMPAEQTGIVKENYLWKCVLRRGAASNSEAMFVMANDGYFDHDLFSIVWGPSIAALSYVFDKSQDEAVIERAMKGFQRCATVAAHYHMSDVLDNLVISLCKFTTLLTSRADEPCSQFLLSFGSNDKALVATKMVFALVQRHGDILRDGWKNITECLLQLFKCKLLPKSMMEAEDYLESTGRVQLYREVSPSIKPEAGFLTSFVSFISMSAAESQANRTRTPEEEEWCNFAAKTVRDCNLDLIITDSKFLLGESLQEWVKFLINQSSVEGEGAEENDQATLFYLEMLVRICIQNRDRVQMIWKPVCDHIAQLITTSTEKTFMIERSVTALLRLAVRLSRKEELASMVVQSLNVLLTLNVNVLFNVCRHIAFGLHELLRNNAANIHDTKDWEIIFALIEIVGAGANPKNAPPENPAPRARTEGEDSGHGASSESDAQTASSRTASPSRSSETGNGEWIVLGKASPIKEPRLERHQPISMPLPYNRTAIVHGRQLVMHDSMSFLKCCESMAFLVRDVAHITPQNFPHCVSTLLTFVEASFIARDCQSVAKSSSNASRSQTKRTPANRAPAQPRRVRSAPQNFDYDADESDSETQDLSSEYHHTSLQLLDLMYTLHTRGGQVHEGDTDVSLWIVAWCPLLQGMARLCCDKRSHIRTSALTTLQRALLFPDLQSMAPKEWENTFVAVLFPLLDQLLVKSNPGEKTAMEETRTRGATLLGKVFLQHLNALTDLATFTGLWLTILEFMKLFIGAATSDMLADAVPESLKNMLLVMDTASIFYTKEGEPTELWKLSHEKLEQFLPGLMGDLFSQRDHRQQQQVKLDGPKVEQTELNETSQEDQTITEVTSQVETKLALEEVTADPPGTPMEPPVMTSTAFAFEDSKSEPASHIPKPPPFSMAPSGPLPSASVITGTPIDVSIPAMPQIAPLPPPPVSLAPANANPAVFQPIHPPPPLPPVSPTQVAVPVALNPQLSNYFNSSQRSDNESADNKAKPSCDEV